MSRIDVNRTSPVPGIDVPLGRRTRLAVGFQEVVHSV
jgi:hypothetical protein